MQQLIFPSSLTELDFGKQWAGEKLPAAAPLPAGLTSLKLASYAGSLAELQLPLSLLQLILNSVLGSNSLCDLRFPVQLRSLCFGTDFNTSLEGVTLPPALTELHFDSDKGVFNHPLEHLELSPGLLSLRLAFFFNHPLAKLRLPVSLTHLHFGRTYNEGPLPALQHTALQSFDLSRCFTSGVKAELNGDFLLLYTPSTRRTLSTSIHRSMLLSPQPRALLLSIFSGLFSSWGDYNQPERYRYRLATAAALVEFGPPMALCTFRRTVTVASPSHTDRAADASLIAAMAPLPLLTTTQRNLHMQLGRRRKSTYPH